MEWIPPQITLRQIHGFLKAAEMLSFSRAAEAMHITQSAFSQLIRELESSLDLRLFDRTTRSIRLTAAGVVLERKLKRGVQEIDSACTQARALARVEHGHITVGCLPSLAIGVVVRSLGAMRRAHPGVTVALREDHNGGLMEGVARGELDFAICARTEDESELCFDPLFDDELVAMLNENDPLARKRGLQWGMLAEVPLILTTVPHSSSRQLVMAALGAPGVSRAIDYDVVNMFTALAMVREGLGVAFIPALTVAHHDVRGLVWRRLRSPTLKRPICICRSPDASLSPAAQKFESLLRQEVGKQAPLV